MFQPNPLASARLTTDPLDLDPAVWPAGTVRDADGALRIGGADARALAAEFGTPLYVVDETVLRARAAAARAAVEGAAAAAGARAHVYYAGKAFLTADVVRWMLDAGLRIDVCTGGELALALAAGVDRPRARLPRQQQVRGGDRRGGRGRRRGDRARLGAGGRPGRRRGGRAHGRVQRGPAPRERGRARLHARVPRHRARGPEVRRRPAGRAAVVAAHPRAEPSLELLGLHSHIGSQIFGTAGFAEAAAPPARPAPRPARGRPGARAQPRRRLRASPTRATDDPARIVEASPPTSSARSSPRPRELRHPGARPRGRARPVDRRPGRRHPLHGRHGQGGRGAGSGRRIRGPPLRLASTAG